MRSFIIFARTLPVFARIISLSRRIQSTRVTTLTDADWSRISTAPGRWHELLRNDAVEIETGCGRFESAGEKKQDMPKPAAWRIAEQERYDALAVVERCLFCPWSYTGTVGEGREKAAQHRREVHPEARRTRRRGPKKNVPHLASFRQPQMSTEEEAEVMEEKAKRMKLLGLV